MTILPTAPYLLARSSDRLHSRLTVGLDQSEGAGVPNSRS